MTQLSLALPAQSVSLTERVARHFWGRPNAWISMAELAAIGGIGGWRTRCSELRKPPYSMQIENRTARVTLANGQRITTSEYRWTGSHKV